MELHQELNKEQNIDYDYEEEEEENEEEEQEKEEGGEQKDEKKINKEEIKGDNKEEEKEESKEAKVEDKKEQNENNIINDKDNINNNNNDSNNKENIKENENKIIEKEEDKKEKIEETIQTNKPQPIIEEIDTTVPKKNEENEGKEEGKVGQVFNPNNICHRLIPKGSDLDISQRIYFRCYKIKIKSNIISFITGSKKIKVPYVIFLDENYYYMAKDKIVNQKNPNLRRIGNKYDLLKLSNFQTTKKEEDYEFAFEFVNEDIFDRTFKLLHFEPEEAQQFYTYIHEALREMGIQIPENMEGNEEEEENEEGEEVEDDQEEGEEGDAEEEREENDGENDNKKEEDNEPKEDIKVENKENNESNEDETKSGTISFKDDENKEIRDVEISQ